MGTWEIEYWDPDATSFVPFTAEIDQVYAEHEGEPYASFWLANTADNRALIQQDLTVNIYFDGELQFTGTLQGGDLEARPTKILAHVVDELFLTLDKAEPITGVYEKPAATILAAILDGTGFTVNTCPSTVIPVVFYHANRLDCMNFLMKALNMEFWHVGTEVYFGTQGGGVLLQPDASLITVSQRALNRRKQFDKIEVRGVDSYGYRIVGTAGTGTRVKVINETEVSDYATLCTVAVRKLSELNTDSAGLPISVHIRTGKTYALGNQITIVFPRYMLNGSYRIMQITKTKTKVTMQLDNFRKPLDATVDELKNWEDRGIYTPGSTTWSLNLQSLVGLFHLNEGTGTVAKNTAPVDTPIDGTIQNCSWADGPVTKLLEFNGSNSVVNLGNESQAGINLTGKSSFGGWFSPSTSDSTDRWLVSKADQFGIKYHSDTGIVTVFLQISGVVHHYDSDADLIKVGGRIFVMATYDQQYVKLYYNGYLHKQWAQTGALDSSNYTVYLGSFLEGILAEVMLWSRALVDQEVLELYFFPLNRVMKGGPGTSEGGNGNGNVSAIADTEILSPVVSGISTIVSVNVGAASWWVNCSYVQTVNMSPTGLQQVSSGSTLAVSASINAVGFAAGFFFPATNPFKLDSTNVGTPGADFTTASYTIPAQTDNTNHTFSPQPALGWVVNCTGTTSDGYHFVASGNGYGASRAGLNTKWYLDGVLVYTGTSYTAPVQTNGSTHTLSCTT